MRVRTWLQTVSCTAASPVLPMPVRSIALVAFVFAPPWHDAQFWLSGPAAFIVNDWGTLQPPPPPPPVVPDWYADTALKWIEILSVATKLTNAAVPPAI